MLDDRPDDNLELWDDLDDDGARAHRYRLHSQIASVDGWLDILESTLIAVRQRELTVEQLERYARLIHDARRVALKRVTNLPAWARWVEVP